MPVSAVSLLFKLALVVFRRKLPSKPEPFRKLPAKVTFFRILTTKPHDYQIFAEVIRIKTFRAYPLRRFLSWFLFAGARTDPGGLVHLLPEFVLIQSLLLSEDKPGGCFATYSSGNLTLALPLWCFYR
jgi:hypothetical protein